jgi:hypothetical protein
MAITNKLLTLILDDMEDSGSTEQRAIAATIRDAASADDMDDDTDITMARATAQNLITICKDFLTQMKKAERNG